VNSIDPYQLIGLHFILMALFPLTISNFTTTCQLTLIRVLVVE